MPSWAKTGPARVRPAGSIFPGLSDWIGRLPIAADVTLAPSRSSPPHYLLLSPPALSFSQPAEAGPPPPPPGQAPPPAAPSPDPLPPRLLPPGEIRQPARGHPTWLRPDPPRRRHDQATSSVRPARRPTSQRQACTRPDALPSLWLAASPPMRAAADRPAPTRAAAGLHAAAGLPPLGRTAPASSIDASAPGHGASPRPITLIHGITLLLLSLPPWRLHLPGPSAPSSTNCKTLGRQAFGVMPQQDSTAVAPPCELGASDNSLLHHLLIYRLAHEVQPYSMQVRRADAPRSQDSGRFSRCRF